MSFKNWFGSISDCLTEELDKQELIKSEISDGVMNAATQLGYSAGQSLNNMLSGVSTISGVTGSLGSSGSFTAAGLAAQLQQAQISQQAQQLQQQYNQLANQLQNVWASPTTTTTTGTINIGGTQNQFATSGMYPGQVINTAQYVQPYDFAQEIQALKDVIGIMRNEIARMRGEIIRLQTFGDKDIHKATDEIMRRMDCYIASA